MKMHRFELKLLNGKLVIDLGVTPEMKVSVFGLIVCESLKVCKEKVSAPT